MEKIGFKLEEDGSHTGGGRQEDFYVLEQTRIRGVDYILVTASEEDEDGEAYILKELKTGEEADCIYEIVSDEIELNAVAEVFSSLLEDTTLSEEG